MTWTRLGLRLRPAGGRDEARTFVGQLEAVARAAEDAGYDTLWLPAAAAAPAPVGAAGVLDPFVLAAVLVPVTSSIRLGCFEQPLAARAPAMLAKAVASLDVLSGARAAVGVEAAGDTEELAEALQVVRSMLTEDAPTLEGSHFRVREAWNEPRRRDGSPPVVLHAGAGAAAGSAAAGAGVAAQQLAAVARLVDGVVVAGPPAPALRAAAPAGLAVIALLAAAAAAGLPAAAGACLEAGCDAVVVDLAAGDGAPGRAARAAAELAPLLAGAGPSAG